ncbi:MAG TPA: MBL fold metallo-hydrolase [bacterium]|nr:MBL fold metallo-hydrolase [bacterium]
MVRILMPLFFLGLGPVFADGSPCPADVIDTSEGPLRITMIGHASLMFEFDGRVIHVDPFTRVSDYDALPRADLILITHEHGDHCDPLAVEKISKAETEIILSRAAFDRLGSGVILENGDTATASGIRIEAVPAYNIRHKRDGGEPYHPGGRGNGYVLTFGDRRIYIAGDTENIPEMKTLEKIDVAFLPMNVPYTMTPEMVADAAAAFRPKILYPYHEGDTDPDRLIRLLENEPDIEIRTRNPRENNP